MHGLRKTLTERRTTFQIPTHRTSLTPLTSLWARDKPSGPWTTEIPLRECDLKRSRRASSSAPPCQWRLPGSSTPATDLATRRQPLPRPHMLGTATGRRSPPGLARQGTAHRSTPPAAGNPSATNCCTIQLDRNGQPNWGPSSTPQSTTIPTSSRASRAGRR